LEKAGENLISVVIPVYNEEDNVKLLYESLVDVLDSMKPNYELIFINDGSTDKTLEILVAIQKKENNETLRVLDLQGNHGQTLALLAGLNNVKGDLVVTMDGDLQNDPNDIPVLYEALTDEYDVICGWRKNRKDNIFKKLPSKFNNFLNRRLNDLHIHDSGCTLRIYRRAAIENLDLYAEGHRYIPAVLAKKGFKIGEIETHHRPRTMGKTKYGFKRLFRGFIDLLTLNALNKWGSKPSHLFSLWSGFFVVISCLVGIWTLLERVAFHHFWSLYPEFVPIRTNPLLLIGIGVFLFSILLLFLGFITELLGRKLTDTSKSYIIKKEWSAKN